MIDIKRKPNGWIVSRSYRGKLIAAYPVVKKRWQMPIALIAGLWAIYFRATESKREVRDAEPCPPPSRPRRQRIL